MDSRAVLEKLDQGLLDNVSGIAFRPGKIPEFSMHVGLDPGEMATEYILQVRIIGIAPIGE
jgi:hypothetical protein